MTSKRLLVVDDRPEVGRMVQRVGEGLGYEVRVTTHAKEFMQAFDSFAPTVIVLDIVMPDIDGIELVTWLHNHGCSAKIIVASAFSPRYAEMAETLGNAKGLEVSFIDKPFRIAELRTALA